MIDPVVLNKLDLLITGKDYQGRWKASIRHPGRSYLSIGVPGQGGRSNVISIDITDPNSSVPVGPDAVVRIGGTPYCTAADLTERSQTALQVHALQHRNAVDNATTTRVEAIIDTILAEEASK